MEDIENWLKSRYSEQLIHANSAFISNIIHDYCTEVVKNNAVLPHVSGSLPIRYCQQCGEPLRRNKHKTWCEHYSGNVR